MFVRNCRNLVVFYFPNSHFLFPLQLINKGKGEALRIRAILRSLVPIEDLVGIISIPLKMPVINKGTDHNMATIYLQTSPRRHVLFICMLQHDVYRILHIQCKVEGY